MEEKRALKDGAQASREVVEGRARAGHTQIHGAGGAAG